MHGLLNTSAGLPAASLAYQQNDNLYHIILKENEGLDVVVACLYATPTKEKLSLRPRQRSSQKAPAQETNISNNVLHYEKQYGLAWRGGVTYGDAVVADGWYAYCLGNHCRAVNPQTRRKSRCDALRVVTDCLKA